MRKLAVLGIAGLFCLAALNVAFGLAVEGVPTDEQAQSDICVDVTTGAIYFPNDVHIGKGNTDPRYLIFDNKSSATIKLDEPDSDTDPQGQSLFIQGQDAAASATADGGKLFLYGGKGRGGGLPGSVWLGGRSTRSGLGVEFYKAFSPANNLAPVAVELDNAMHTSGFDMLDPASGANDNFNLIGSVAPYDGGSTTHKIITSPSADFSFSGFSFDGDCTAPPALGYDLVIHNSTIYNMTIKDEDTGSVADCRIDAGGSDRVTIGKGTATFKYDINSFRWILLDFDE